MNFIVVLHEIHNVLLKDIVIFVTKSSQLQLRSQNLYTTQYPSSSSFEFFGTADGSGPVDGKRCARVILVCIMLRDMPVIPI